MSTVSVRYIVDDVDASIAFYCTHLGFTEVMHPDPAFAMLSRGDLRFVVVSPVGAEHRGGGSRPMPDGRRQEPGGWNRFMIEVADLDATVETLRRAGANVLPSETVFYSMLHDAKHPFFKTLTQLVKKYG